MSSVFVPVRVVSLLKSLVNVISTISISNQYLLKQRATAEDQEPQEPPASWVSLDWEWWKSGDRWYWNLGRPETGILHSRAFQWSWNSFTLPLLPELRTNQSYEPAQMPPSRKFPPDPPPESDALSRDTIHQLIRNPTLYNPLRTPRYPIVLCHGLYGFDERGLSSFPSMRMQYWSNVLRILRRTVGAEVIVTAVPSTGSIASRAESLDRQLCDKVLGRGINLLAHSMGGLDCRHLITHVKPSEYTPLSLTTVSTPHRGSPFMDWCAENIGIGRLIQREGERLAKTIEPAVLPAPPEARGAKPNSNPFYSLSFSSLPSSFTTLLISILDSPAYSNLTSTYLNTVFNPSTPNSPAVKYFSVAGRMPNVNLWHPFWLPKMVLDGVEKKERERLRDVGENICSQLEEWGHDGLVTVQSAKWGEFLGVMEGVDHWEIRGARGLDIGGDFFSSDEGEEEGQSRDWAWLAKASRKEKADLRVESEKTLKTKITRQQERDLERQRDDDVVKASTDKLSAVFDWIVEQVPTPSPLLKKDCGSEVLEKKEVKMRNDLATKKDLERFYVALSRKMYDEGL
ncbi:alpha/beta-hydrolase [Guyanagaster necrorhizus]|uniref:Alpha/beta-hydrolase n=1 Tax=Guyanagaster necrorhizus TaxID=856835 RepID=A0A9P7VPL0_9AGAR|nr:alpha/beta-hydrolase [Guyanagaster necrorhizus MCA 3950]KAG7444150.1 alpha/beta-hydrolase [Guyanagaster necrorhizus MCA 3950]